MNDTAAIKWIGMPVERLEDPPLVTGRGRFAADINFARQRHMRIVRSNHAHANIVSIDRMVAANATGWTIDRMPVLDRSILRLATYELIAEPEVPVAVIIDEAVELAKQYSTEFSGGFVNGVLATIARQVRV